MKTPQHFGLIYFTLAIAQIIIGNCFHLSAYITLSILPVMVLCIPLNVGTIAAMLIAFATGLAADASCEGLAGLNALALVPVAFIRKPLIRLVFGEELIERKQQFSIRKFGWTKTSAAILAVQSIFLIIYIIADGAGARPFWFNASRFGASLAAGWLLSLAVAAVIVPDDKK